MQPESEFLDEQQQRAHRRKVETLVCLCEENQYQQCISFDIVEQQEKLAGYVPTNHTLVFEHRRISNSGSFFSSTVYKIEDQLWCAVRSENRRESVKTNIRLFFDDGFRPLVWWCAVWCGEVHTVDNEW